LAFTVFGFGQKNTGGHGRSKNYKLENGDKVV
jgi:hypothetical protein